jgi:hypothetical protein
MDIREFLSPADTHVDVRDLKTPLAAVNYRTRRRGVDWAAGRLVWSCYRAHCLFPFGRSGERVDCGLASSQAELVIFDGDFATLTVALFDDDPLQSAVGVVLRNLVHSPYIMRRLRALVTAARFWVQSVEPHGYVQTPSPDYLLTLLSRGTAAFDTGRRQ